MANSTALVIIVLFLVFAAVFMLRGNLFGDNISHNTNNQGAYRQLPTRRVQITQPVEEKLPVIHKKSSPWDDMLTTKDLLPKQNDAWKKYGCDTFVPQTDDLLAAHRTPQRITQDFGFSNNTNSISKNRDLRGVIPVKVDNSYKDKFSLVAVPDGYYDDNIDYGRSINIIS